MAIYRTANNSWMYLFRYKGNRYKKRFKSRDKALKAEAKKRLDLNKGLDCDERLMFSEAAHLFLENHAKANKAQKSWMNDASKIEYLNGLFGEKKLVDFTPLDIQNMRSCIMDMKLTSRTADRYHSLVKTIFNKMIIWRKFHGFNPANGVKLKREPNAHIRFLSKDEMRQLDQHLKNQDVYPYYVAGLHTGMRLGELLRLKWEDITFPIRDLFIPKSKSGKSRHVPISDVLYGLLRDLYGTGKNDKELVLGTLNGDKIYRRFMKACRKLKIKDFRFHDLRHTFASHLVMAGVSIFQVSKWLGHSSVTTTEKYYAHLSPDNRREEINCLNKLAAYAEPEVQEKTEESQKRPNFGENGDFARIGSIENCLNIQ